MEMASLLSDREKRTCIKCGKNFTTGKRHRRSFDHLYPQCMVSSTLDRGLEKIHPLWVVIYQPQNLFAVGRTEHDLFDEGKIAAFFELPKREGNVQAYKLAMSEIQAQSSRDRGNPEKLVEFLMKNYPLSQSIKGWELQAKKMKNTNNLLIGVVSNLNGELSQSLKRSYQRAAIMAGDFNQELDRLLGIPLPLTS